MKEAKSKHREIFEQFAERAQEELGDSLKQLYLYGSVARGEEEEDSDVDVFAVVEEKENLDALRDIAYRKGVLDNGVFISVQGQNIDRFAQREDHPFIQTVRREGETYV